MDISLLKLSIIYVYVILEGSCHSTLLSMLCFRLRNVLFPTLISACYENEENKRIIEQEVSCALLENYVEVKYIVSKIDVFWSFLIILVLLK